MTQGRKNIQKAGSGSSADGRGRVTPACSLARKLGLLLRADRSGAAAFGPSGLQGRG